MVEKRNVLPPEVCPVCGEAVPRGARACPGCGADERSGWNDEATRYDGLDLPDEAFDQPERGRRSSQPARPKIWFIVAGVLLLLLISGLMFR